MVSGCKHVLILAGGGGHTGYAYALAQALKGRAFLSFLVPEGDTLSERRLREFGNVNFLVKPREPKPRESKTSASLFALGLFRSFFHSMKLPLNEFDVVVSSGSNFCVFPGIIAWFRGVPVVNIESEQRFVRPSRTAFVLQPFSKVTALWWEEQKRLLRGIVAGPLLPKPLVEPQNKGYILVTGGTYGHKLLFDSIAKSDLRNVVLQTGKVDPTSYKKMHPEWKVVTVMERFHEVIAGAEIVVTHLGFTSLEALAYGKPVVIVVNPEWTLLEVRDAAYLAKKVNGVLVSQISTETVLDAVDEARKRTVPLLKDGAENLANLILDTLS